MLSPHDGGLPVYVTLTEMMGATIRLSFHGGLIAAFPVAVLSIYYLVRPVLNRRQRRTVGLFLPLILLLFLGGNAFAYYVLLPAGVQYLIAFGDGVAVPVITISSYMNLSMETWVSRAFRRLLAWIARMAKLSRRSVDSPSTLERTE
jgi:sec-independent protein translocase protein TatC